VFEVVQQNKPSNIGAKIALWWISKAINYNYRKYDKPLKAQSSLDKT